MINILWYLPLNVLVMISVYKHTPLFYRVSPSINSSIFTKNVRLRRVLLRLKFMVYFKEFTLNGNIVLMYNLKYYILYTIEIDLKMYFGVIVIDRRSLTKTYLLYLR